MDDEEINLANEISEFLKSSCLPRDAKIGRFDLTKFLRGLSRSARHPVNGMKCRKVPVHTGSVAEFYIEPMLSCTGDVDIMYFYDNELAIAKGQLPPDQLPGHFGSRVRVLEIVDSYALGYVHLVFACLLSKDSSGERYVVDYVSRSCTFSNHAQYVSDKDASESTIHGPARRHYMEMYGSLMKHSPLQSDAVPCIRCLNWPPQAVDWIIRQRNYEWPNSATIDVVVNNGCDVVGVAHPMCRDDEWMRNHQWRLSFSRAEVVLLNSWLPEQQIVYHMLRSYVKMERLTGVPNKTCGTDTFSNYHIKTLMLWACEIKPRNWWADGSSLLSICTKTMHFLVEWLTAWQGQHYFIYGVHFSDYIDTPNIDTVLAAARSTTEDSLSHWFVDNYIRKCAEMCPDNTSLSFCVSSTKKNIRDILFKILQWKDHHATLNVAKHYWTNLSSAGLITDKDDNFFEYFKDMARSLVFMPIAAFMRQTERPKIESHLQSFAAFFFSMVCSAVGYGNRQMLFGGEDLLIHTLVVFYFHADQTLIPANLQTLTTSMKKATFLMKIIAKKKLMRNTSELHLAAIDLAKLCLKLALTGGDADTDSVHSLGNVYSAVLHYMTGHIQTAIDHCMLVIRSQNDSTCVSSAIQGEALLELDGDVDRVLGLLAIYQYVRLRTVMGNQETSSRLSGFSPEMFAHYFLIKHLFVAKCRIAPAPIAKKTVQAIKHDLSEHLQGLRKRLQKNESMYVSDLMLFKLPNNSPQCKSKCAFFINSLRESETADAIARFSVEHLMNSRTSSLINPVKVNNISDCLALSLYRCELYQQCIELCQRNTHNVDAAARALSTTYYEFIQLMDDDIVSLVGLTALLHEGARRSKLEDTVTVSPLVLSLYLLTQSHAYYKNAYRAQHADTLVSLMAGLLDRTADAERIVQSASFIDNLMLKLTERLAVAMIVDSIQTNA